GSILGNIVDNATLTFARSDNVTFANIISGTGGFVQAGAGTLIFSNNNTYAGGTLISNGTLQLGNGAAAGMHGLGDVVNNSHLIFNRSDGGHYDQVISGTGDVTKAGAGTLIYTRDNTYSGGTTISDGAIQVGRNSYDPADPYELITNTGGTTGSIGAGPVLNNSHLIFNRSDNISYTGTVTGTGDFIKNGSGALTISSNANAFSGGVVINAGKLLVTNSAGSATGSGAVNVNNGAAFGGTGLISGALIINGGGSVSPGSSPGQLQVGNGTTFASGGHYVFEINNTAGAPGTNWDLLSISGGLTISATVSTPFVLDLVSLNAGNTNGLLANFDPTLAYSWKFVTTTTGITGFSAGAFQYNASNFSNSLDIGHFYVSQAGNDLYLNFTPVPEPTTWVLLSLGLSSVLLSLRRKSRARLVESRGSVPCG
ncbi:MAG: PEP-CTERM sorting domain-containing protein, partial [Opitutaceae bacterium]|nr:PEP-CTERM sorting domain-containing protein [Opitutaceae bacterium]